MKNAVVLLSFVMIAMIAMTSSVTRAADWPQWRGPDRDGISAEKGLLKKWPEGGPALVWSAENAGEGYASVAVADGRVFTMGNRSDGDEYVIAYDEKSGKELWAVKTGKGFRNGQGDGPRGTPTVDGRRLYAEGANGELLCLDVESGEKHWGLNILSQFGGRNIGWGLSESPLVVDDRVIVTPGGKQASVVALDKTSGKTLWQSPGARAGYSSPIVAQTGRARQVIVFHEKAVVGVRLNDGKPLWAYEKVANSTANITTPIYYKGHVFVTSDYGTGCALLRLTGRGVKEVYFNREMKNHHGGVVLVGRYLYGCSSDIWTCLDFASGKRIWKDRGVGKGSVVFADGHLYCLGERGKVALVKATANRYQEVSRFDIGRGRQKTWAHPAIANGRLYLRKDDRLMCYDVRTSPE